MKPIFLTPLLSSALLGSAPLALANSTQTPVSGDSSLRPTFLSSALMAPTSPIKAPQSAVNDEFVGPFSSWANLQRDYGAKGDGVADDTAAIQRALDDLKVDGKSKILFLPPGTYRITQTLRMLSQIDCGVLGADPDTTKIVWDGPANEPMLFCNGVRYSRFGRLTWDGRGKAGTAVAHQWDGETPSASTYNEHADSVFKDVKWGIRAGKPHFMDAECAVLRCRFVRCSEAGLSIESFNALDWWVWDSTFEECKVGATNDPGAGHFHVYNSLFLRSKEADIKTGNSSYFGIRGNTSIGSKAFLLVSWAPFGSHLTVQGNTILRPTGPEVIRYGQAGALLLLDNVIDAPQSATARPVQISIPNSLVAVGNTFSRPNFLGVRQSDDKTAPVRLDNTVNPALLQATRAQKPLVGWPGTAPSRGRQVFEVKARSDAATIQNAINLAARAGSRSVVHLAAGEYQIDRTLTIPANADLQLVGDGFATTLKWTGEEGETVLRLAGPTRAVVRDFQIAATNAGTGIAVEGCNTPGSRVWMQQGSVNGARSVGLFADGLDETDVSLHNFYHSDIRNRTPDNGKGEAVAVKFVGGPRSQAGASTPARVAIFGGASSNNDVSYDLKNNARLQAEDIWYEGEPPRFFNFDAQSSGTFTLNGATTASGRPGPNAAVQDPNFAALKIEGFRGTASLLGVNVGARLVVAGRSPQASVWAITHGDGDYVENRSPDARFVLSSSSKYIENGGGAPIPNIGVPDAPFVRKMLAQLRTSRPRPLADNVPQGATDLRLYRVTVRNADVGVHLR